ncbi:MAG: radical SAM protein [Bacteroidales bacterium]
MSTFLFDSLVFGPVFSRRLGRSLGINLLPVDAKLCNYDCIYCECGWSGIADPEGMHYPRHQLVAHELERRLEEILQHGEEIDAITFAGNGEPTLHPQFPAIVRSVNDLRNRFFPSAKTAVLSNASRIHLEEVREAVLMTDIHMLKLDAGSEETYRLLNGPPAGFSLERLMENLSLIRQGLVIQSLFVRGMVNGKLVDNTRPEETEAWLGKLRILKPEKVIVYSIERDTAADGLKAVPAGELEQLAERVRQSGMLAEIY